MLSSSMEQLFYFALLLFYLFTFMVFKMPLPHRTGVSNVVSGCSIYTLFYLYLDLFGTIFALHFKKNVAEVKT